MANLGNEIAEYAVPGTAGTGLELLLTSRTGVTLSRGDLTLPPHTVAILAPA